VTLTAVETFAKRHDEADLPANERYYRELIPLTVPADGEQYGFEVDLDDCTGCKACVTACHSLNGLDDDESWRSVGFLQGTGKVAFQQTVTTACHHCVEPACLSGCPVDAYEKDPVTGVVSHLDDQCIGCSYCTLTCPYEVPRFNEARGIVRKCDMCRGRLAVGEAPACVQACPNGAIRISIVAKADARARASVGGAAVVPGAPDSAITVPTTIYRTTRPIPTDVRAADHHSLRPAHPHPPLAAMLVLTQLAVGLLALEVGARLGGSSLLLHPAHALVAAAVAVVALVASTLHLGRPRYAFRAVIGFRHSWLSREVIAFGAFGLLSCLYAAVVARLDGPPWVLTALGIGAVVSGVAGVGCSVLLYAVTRRAWWAVRRTLPTFVLSAAATGALGTLSVVLLTGAGDADGFRVLGLATAAAGLAKLVNDAAPILTFRAGADDDRNRSVLLLRRDLGNQTQVRFILGVIGGVVLPAALSGTHRASVGASMVAVAALMCLIAGELVERHQFFRVAVAPRMPGELP
jgi:formate dehydrogenase iron-sulfur subunit